MESLKNIFKASRALFFLCGFLIFSVAFCLRNGIFFDFAKPIIFIIDLPFLFFTLIYFITAVKIREGSKGSSITGDIAILLSIIFFGFILFYHFAYPDLI